MTAANKNNRKASRVSGVKSTITQTKPTASTHDKGRPGFGGFATGSAASADAELLARAKAERARWADLETWIFAALSTLEGCTRCVTWTSPTGYIAGLAYVRLFALVLRLLCPSTGQSELEALLLSGQRKDSDMGYLPRDPGVSLAGAMEGPGVGVRDEGSSSSSADGAGGGDLAAEMLGKLKWGCERLGSLVDDLMWRLREGLPGRDVRLRLLKTTCSHMRVLAGTGGGGCGRDGTVSDDVLMELVSVLQVWGQMYGCGGTAKC